MGYESLVRMKKKSNPFENWLLNYVKEKPVVAVSTISTFFGFLIYLTYSWKIQFLALPNGTDTFLFLAILASIGFSFLISLIAMVLLPGLVWRISALPANQNFSHALISFLCALALCEVIAFPDLFPCLKFTGGLIVAFLFVGVVLGVVFFDAFFKKEEWLNSFLKFILFFICVTILPVISLYAFLILIVNGGVVGNIEFSELWIGVIALFFLVSLGYMINVIVVTSKRREFLIAPFIVIAIVLGIAPSLIPISIVKMMKLGCFNADITLTKSGLEVYNLPLNTNKDKTDSFCILSRIGSQVLIEIPVDGHSSCNPQKTKNSEGLVEAPPANRILIDKKYIVSVSWN